MSTLLEAVPETHGLHDVIPPGVLITETDHDVLQYIVSIRSPSNQPF